METLLNAGRPRRFARKRNGGRIALGALCLSALPTLADTSPLIEEVLVTAQKREQSLQDVSIAVTAFTGDQLAALGVTQPIDVQAHVPNFHMKNEIGKATPTLTLRGVGIGAFSHNAVSPVGVYVDELFLASTSQMSFTIYDVERVEVLKGPQGTLFGRNTTAGAVHFVSRKPTDEFEASVRLGTGNYQSAQLEAYASGPLAPNLAGRVAVSHVRQDKGFFADQHSGEHIGDTDVWGIKGALLWDASDAATLWVQAHVGRERSENYPWVAIGTADANLPVSSPHLPGGQVFSTDCAPLATTPTRFFQENCVTRNGYRDPDLDSFKGHWSLVPALDVDAFGVVARLDIDWGTATLTAVTGFNDLEKVAEEDFDGSPFALADSRYGSDISAFSQEVRIASNDPAGGWLDWMAGAVYYSEEQDQNDLYGYVDRVNHDVGVYYSQDTTSFGAFVHAEARLAERWSLIAGARYTNDAIDFVGETTLENIQPGGPQPVFGPFTFATLFGEYGTLMNPDAISYADDGLRTDELTYKVGIDFRPSDDWLLYASTSRGYKSGGFVGFWTTSSEEWGPFGAEFVDAVEAGFKASLVDGTLRLNGALFSYDYRDAQIFGLTPTSAFTILNSGEGDFVGGELELQWMLGGGFDVVAGLGYIDAELVIGGEEPVRPGNTPELTFNGILRHQMALPNGLALSLQADFSYQDDVFFDATERLSVGQEAYWLVNARLTLSNSRDTWELSAWARNLANEAYFSQIFRSGTAAALSAVAGSPRTYGVEATFRF